MLCNSTNAYEKSIGGASFESGGLALSTITPREFVLVLILIKIHNFFYAKPKFNFA